MSKNDLTSALTLPEKINRFLYLGNFNNKYITGDYEKHCFFNEASKEGKALLAEIAKMQTDDFIELLKKANADVSLPRRDTIFFALAVALNLIADTVVAEKRHHIGILALELCKTDEEFFTFIKYYVQVTERKTKFPTLLKKVAQQFYKHKTPMELAESYIKGKRYRAWRHKDILKLSHYKPENKLKEFVCKCILFDLKDLKTRTDYDADEKKIAEALTRALKLRESSDPTVSVPLITELHADYNQINPLLFKNPEVWTALIQEASPKTVLKHLPRLYKYGLLKNGSAVHTKVVECLTNVDKVKQCGLHPVQVFIYLKIMEHGGKKMDPKLELFLKSKAISEAAKASSEGDAAANNAESKLENGAKAEKHEAKCPLIINAIHKCLGLSYQNLKPTNKRFLITIDASETGEDPCMHNRNITCHEAAVALTLSLLKVEKDVTVAVFDMASIEVLKFEKNIAYPKALQIIREKKKPAHILPLAAVDWANKNKKHFDVFINIIHEQYPLAQPEAKELRDKHDKNAHIFKQYRTSVKLNNAKIIMMCLQSIRLEVLNENRNIIDIAGFSGEIPKLIEAFIRGSFT